MPPPPSSPPPAPLRPRRLPSRRVSALVSQLEAAAAPSPGSPIAPTRVPSTRQGSTASGTGGADDSSAAPEPAVAIGALAAGPASREAVLRGGVVVGDVGRMDWTPKSPPVAAARGGSSQPFGTESGPSGSNSRATSGESAGRHLASPRPKGKAALAATVVVPASVSPAREGRPAVTVQVSSIAASASDSPLRVVDGRLPEEQRPAETAPDPPPSSSAVAPAHDNHPEPPSSRAEAAPAPNKSSSTSSPSPVSPSPAFMRPPLEPRRSSVTWAEIVSPQRESLDLGTDSASIVSSLSAVPLLPPSSPPARPPLPRSFSSQRSTTSAPALASGPSSRFTVGSSGTASTRCVYAYELFARDAEPLILPELDHVLESLGGPAQFSPMPGPSDDRKKGGDAKGEEWELRSLEQGKAADGADEVFGSELEREGWDNWVCGEAPTRWKRLASAVKRVFVRKRSRLAEPDERDPFDTAASAAGLSRTQYLRTLKFPPFHLIPHKLTVTDLKANRRKPPPLISVQSLLLAASNGILGAAGSTVGLNLTTIEGLRDLMQMVTLLLTAASPSLSTLNAGSKSSAQPSAQSSTLRTLFVTVPSVLSLDFVTAFGQALALLLVLTVVTLGALYEVYRLSGGWHGPSGEIGRGEHDLGEGFDRENLQERPRKWRDSCAWRVAVTFWCGSFYLPLSKLAIGALVWSDDYWAVANPYELFGVDDPAPPPLGPSSDFYDPMDFCWRTTMRRRDGAQNLNAAWALVPVAIVILVKRERPRVDGWTELGERRRDVDAEYERLLDADPSPFNFLYRDYRRQWAAFRSIYLVFKLVNVLLVVLVQKNNCVFRTYGETYLSVVRQGSLLAVMALFCLASALSSPYLTRISNSSDIVSRVGYVFFAMLGLLAALSLPGTDPAVVTTNIVVYGLNIYFTLVALDFSQRLVKKAQRRLDSSIDIFSPALDVSKHIIRRVWQETLAALLLCSPDFAMQSSAKLEFSQDPQLPPYLLNFGASVAERFIEDLKARSLILRELGLDAYSDAARDCESCPDDARLAQLRRVVQLRLTGPDIYFRPERSPPSISTYFGRVDVVPFPFVVVFRYDQQPTEPLHLVNIEGLELLVEQNRQADVLAARKVRLALRALEDQVVFAPHIEVWHLGATGGAVVERHVSYRMAYLRLKRNSDLAWRGYNYASGFTVLLEYADGEGTDSRGRLIRGQKLVLAGSEFGVHDDFQLTADLSLLLRRNRVLVEQRLPTIERSLLEHRTFFRHEADLKRRVLSYSFLLNVFAEGNLSLDEIDAALHSGEPNPKVQQLVQTHKASITRLEERMRAVTGGGVRAWWYLFWDDQWRRNHDVGLPEEAFSPHISTSICYHPMTRSELETFLREHGFPTGERAYFHTGLLNRLYFHLDEQVFSSTSRAIPIHLSSSPNRIPFAALPHALPHHHPSMPPDRREASAGTALTRSSGFTGGGTSENDPSIRHRAAFLFEEAYERPAPHFRKGSRVEWARYQVGVRATGWAKRFAGLEPVVRDWRPSEDEGIVLDLRRGRTGWEAPRHVDEAGGEEEAEKMQ